MDKYDTLSLLISDVQKSLLHISLTKGLIYLSSTEGTMVSRSSSRGRKKMAKQQEIAVDMAGNEHPISKAVQKKPQAKVKPMKQNARPQSVSLEATKSIERSIKSSTCSPRERGRKMERRYQTKKHNTTNDMMQHPSSSRLFPGVHTQSSMADTSDKLFLKSNKYKCKTNLPVHTSPPEKYEKNLQVTAEVVDQKAFVVKLEDISHLLQSECGTKTYRSVSLSRVLAGQKEREDSKSLSVRRTRSWSRSRDETISKIRYARTSKSPEKRQPRRNPNMSISTRSFSKLNQGQKYENNSSMETGLKSSQNMDIDEACQTTEVFSEDDLTGSDTEDEDTRTPILVCRLCLAEWSSRFDLHKHMVDFHKVTNSGAILPYSFPSPNTSTSESLSNSLLNDSDRRGSKKQKRKKSVSFCVGPGESSDMNISSVSESNESSMNDMTVNESNERSVCLNDGAKKTEEVLLGNFNLKKLSVSVKRYELFPSVKNILDSDTLRIKGRPSVNMTENVIHIKEDRKEDQNKEPTSEINSKTQHLKKISLESYMPKTAVEDSAVDSSCTSPCVLHVRKNRTSSSKTNCSQVKCIDTEMKCMSPKSPCKRNKANIPDSEISSGSPSKLYDLAETKHLSECDQAIISQSDIDRNSLADLQADDGCVDNIDKTSATENLDDKTDTFEQTVDKYMNRSLSSEIKSQPCSYVRRCKSKTESKQVSREGISSEANKELISTVVDSESSAKSLCGENTASYSERNKLSNKISSSFRKKYIKQPSRKCKKVNKGLRVSMKHMDHKKLLAEKMPSAKRKFPVDAAKNHCSPKKVSKRVNQDESCSLDISHLEKDNEVATSTAIIQHEETHNFTRSKNSEADLNPMKKNLVTSNLSSHKPEPVVTSEVIACSTGKGMTEVQKKDFLDIITYVSKPFKLKESEQKNDQKPNGLLERKSTCNRVKKTISKLNENLVSVKYKNQELTDTCKVGEDINKNDLICVPSLIKEKKNREKEMPVQSKVLPVITGKENQTNCNNLPQNYLDESMLEKSKTSDSSRRASLSSRVTVGKSSDRYTSIENISSHQDEEILRAFIETENINVDVGGDNSNDEECDDFMPIDIDSGKVLVEYENGYSETSCLLNMLLLLEKIDGNYCEKFLADNTKKSSQKNVNQELSEKNGKPDTVTKETGKNEGNKSCFNKVCSIKNQNKLGLDFDTISACVPGDKNLKNDGLVKNYIESEKSFVNKVGKNLKTDILAMRLVETEKSFGNTVTLDKISPKTSAMETTNNILSNQIKQGKESKESYSQNWKEVSKQKNNTKKKVSNEGVLSYFNDSNIQKDQDKTGLLPLDDKHRKDSTIKHKLKIRKSVADTVVSNSLSPGTAVIKLVKDTQEEQVKKSTTAEEKTINGKGKLLADKENISDDGVSDLETEQNKLDCVVDCSPQNFTVHNSSFGKAVIDGQLQIETSVGNEVELNSLSPKTAITMQMGSSFNADRKKSKENALDHKEELERNKEMQKTTEREIDQLYENNDRMSSSVAEKLADEEVEKTGSSISSSCSVSDKKKAGKEHPYKDPVEILYSVEAENNVPVDSEKGIKIRLKRKRKYSFPGVEVSMATVKTADITDKISVRSDTGILSEDVDGKECETDKTMSNCEKFDKDYLSKNIERNSDIVQNELAESLNESCQEKKCKHSTVPVITLKRIPFFKKLEINGMRLKFKGTHSQPYWKIKCDTNLTSENKSEPDDILWGEGNNVRNDILVDEKELSDHSMLGSVCLNSKPQISIIEENIQKGSNLSSKEVFSGSAVKDDRKKVKKQLSTKQEKESSEKECNKSKNLASLSSKVKNIQKSKKDVPLTEFDKALLNSGKLRKEKLKQTKRSNSLVRQKSSDSNESQVESNRDLLLRKSKKCKTASKEQVPLLLKSKIAQKIVDNDRKGEQSQEQDIPDFPPRTESLSLPPLSFNTTTDAGNRNTMLSSQISCNDSSRTFRPIGYLKKSLESVGSVKNLISSDPKSTRLKDILSDDLSGLKNPFGMCNEPFGNRKRTREQDVDFDRPDSPKQRKLLEPSLFERFLNPLHRDNSVSVSFQDEEALSESTERKTIHSDWFTPKQMNSNSYMRLNSPDVLTDSAFSSPKSLESSFLSQTSGSDVHKTVHGGNKFVASTPANYNSVKKRNHLGKIGLGSSDTCTERLFPLMSETEHFPDLSGVDLVDGGSILSDESEHHSTQKCKIRSDPPETSYLTGKFNYSGFISLILEQAYQNSNCMVTLFKKIVIQEEPKLQNIAYQ